MVKDVYVCNLVIGHTGKETEKTIFLLYEECEENERQECSKALLRSTRGDFY